jgi:alcohol dehydrogenase class IV
MSVLGVNESQLDEFTQEAVQIRRLLDNCPVPLDAAQIKAIYQDAL